MAHHAPLLVTIAAAVVVAFILGFAAQKVRLSPIVGYLAAGMAIGPFTPGFVGDTDLASQLAEIGVILLMFGVGLHFSLGDLWAVRRASLPGALVQMSVATAAGTAFGLWWGWSWAGALLFGVALSVASTVVMLRALGDEQLLDTRAGHIAVGWLIVEDLAMVAVLVVVPVVADGAGGDSLGLELGVTLIQVVAFGLLMGLVGKRVIPWVLARTADTGSRELFTLGVLAVGLGIAVGAAWFFEVSFALGAFVAGMILKGSELSHRAAEDSLPLRDAFAVLFFVSVGMLVDPRIVVERPLEVLVTAAIIVVGKSLAAYGIVRLLRYSRSMSLVVAASLAQIGEFSFILVTLGTDLGLLEPEARDLVLAGAIVSIVVNPLLFALAARRYRRDDDEVGESAAVERGHVIVAGFGRVGARTTAALRDAGTDVVVIDDNEANVHLLGTDGVRAVLGNAARRKALAAAGIASAHTVLVAIPDPLVAGAVVAAARKAAPAVTIVARGHSDADVAHLTERGADRVVVGVHEVADIMVSAATSD